MPLSLYAGVKQPCHWWLCW